MAHRISLPPLDEVGRRWEEIEPLVHRATDVTLGCYEPEHVMRDCLEGKRGFWLIEDGDKAIGFCVAGAEQYDTGKRVWRIKDVAGDRCEEWWADLIRLMEYEARKWRCECLISTARPGWERFSRKLGIELKPISILYMREV